MSEVKVKAKKIYNQKLFTRIVKIVFLLLLIALAIIYLFLYVVYDTGRFTVALDKTFSNQKSVYLSLDGDYNSRTRKLTADTIDYMDNISEKWLPDNLDTDATGSHNGDNYIAYTFYVVNGGNDAVNYWYEIDIDDTIKSADEAVRIMVYHNGVAEVYAKKSSTLNGPEPGTTMFYSNSIAVLKQRKNLKSKSKDRFTIVVWIEGDDLDCNNDLLGGEIKMHMDITEEHIEKNNRRKKI